MSELIDVNQILRSPSSQLVHYQVLLRDVSHGDLIVHHPRLGGLISLVEGQSVDATDDVDSERGDADLKDQARTGEVGNGHVGKIGSVVRQRLVGGDCVLGIWLDKKVEVFGRARLGVLRVSVAADDQVANVMRVECGQQIFEVLVHLARAPSCDTSPA